MKPLRNQYFLIFFVFTFFINKMFSMDQFNVPDHFANQDGIPSSIVNGVNVISGDYCEFSQDLMNPGIAQHHFDRCNLSSNLVDGNICCSWNSNFGGIAKVSKYESKNKVNFTVHHKSLYGAYTTYERKFDKKGMPHNFLLEVDKNSYEKGLTNTGKGYIAAATHPKNNRLHYDSHHRKISIVNSEGEESLFKYNSKHELYVIDETKQLNKHKLKYSYHPNGFISKAAVCNSHNEEISKFETHYNISDDPHVQIYGDGGSSVRYNLVGYDSSFEITYWYIRNVVSNRFPSVSYAMEKFDLDNYDMRMRITRKFMPRNNVLNIDYYRENKKLKIDKFDPKLHRVSCLSRSIKNDTKPAKLINTFEYSIDEDKPGKGGTTVKYPNKAPTDYFYDKYRLTKIIQKIKNDNNSFSPYLVQQFYWLDWTDYKGNLEKKILSNGSGELLESTSYYYDLKGNVLEEHYRGHLTGNSSFVNPNDCFIKRNTYYQDKRNLLESTDDGRKKIHYGYYDDTNLVKFKFVIANGKIQLRNYYEYDKNSAVTLEIVDDGCNEDQNDLTAVTERHITETINRTEFPIGLPKVIFTKYLDKNTGNVETLNRKEFFYTCEGWLEREELFDQNNQLIALQRYIYDSQGKVIESYDILGQGTFKKYDEAGNVVRVQTPQYDFHTNYHYDLYNRLVREDIVQYNGLILTKHYQYDDSDNKIFERDIYGNVTKYTYDSLNRIIQKEMPSGEIQRFDYNCRNQVISQIDHYGNTTSFEYTSRNQPIRVHYPDGREDKFRYDLDGTLLITMDKDGTITENTVDYQGRLIKKVVKSEEGEYLFETKSEYNAFHLLKEIDAAGNETIYEYDSLGREINVTKGDHVKQTCYDGSNRVSHVRTYSTVDHIGIVTRYEYDLLNRITCEQKYDDYGNIQKEEYFSYDSSGNIIETVSYGHAGRSTSRMQYDIFGNVILSIDPEENQTICEISYEYYNENGKNVGYQKVTDPMGNVTITIKDIAGHDACIISKDAFNKELHKTTYVYNHLGLLSQKTEHVYKDEKVDREIVKQIFYDHVGNVVSVVNAVGTPLQREIYIAYNKNGQKSCVKKSDGTYLNYIYGPRGLLTEFLSSDRSIHYRYEYDRLDNLIKMTDVLSGTSTVREYNSHKQMIYEKLSNDLEMRYSYHINNCEKNVLLSDGSYFENHYKGSCLDKIKRFNAKGEFQYEHCYEDYDKRGCYKSVQLAGNAGKIEFTYDTLGRLRSSQTKHWREVIAAFDDAGNLTQREISNNNNSQTENYTYDSLYQLLSEKNHIYQYDSLHNRISKDGKLHDINELNQVKYDGENHYEYDLCGNLTKISGQRHITFTYDALDRLRSVEKENERFIYQYDAKNRRVSKEKQLQNTEGKWSCILLERYLYQDQCEIGSVDTQGNIYQLRIIGSGKGAEIGASIALEIDHIPYVPIHDHQGNIASLISIEDGSVVESYEYSAFGEEIIYDSEHREKEFSMQPWHFSSKRLDAETGFVYFGYRYYSKELGKWITSDPLGDKDGPNLYAYVKNRPYAFFDSFGLFCEFDDEMPYPYYSPGCYSSIGSGCLNVGSSIAYGTGRAIELSAFHSLPPTQGKYYLMSIGAFLQNKKLEFDPRELRSPETIKVGSGQIRPGAYTIAITGISSEKPNTIEFAQSISNNMGNSEVYGICNPSNGALTDMCLSIASYYCLRTTYSDYIASELKRFHAMALKESRDPILFVNPHSRGTMDTKMATNLLSLGIRNSLIVHAYGGEVLDRKNYAFLKNTMNEGDPLILINPTHWFNSSEITWTNEPMSWNIIKNHYIMERGYQKAIKDNTSKHYEKYRQQ